MHHVVRRALAILLMGSCGTATAVVCHAQESFPAPYDSETDLSVPRLSPAEAAAKFRLPDGFRVEVFAAEPQVSNPIAVAWDPRGRLWVAENFTYAERPKKFELALRDRVLILTDRDGDGRAEEPQVFLDDAQRLTSVEVGLGGVWLMCPPQLLFVPDRNGDDRPDGPAEAVLEGFDVPPENFHNFANGLRWGPDGWLYGRCGASAPGLIRRADVPNAYQVPLRGGLWRYHPATKQFEALCHGTTNPWGHDWDRYGEAFFINTVNGHLWHLIPGAHLRRPHTINAHPLVYEPIETHADHWHWDTGKDWADSRKATGEHDVRGGGHAHVGMMIYQGEQWPEQYRGRLMTLNQHGRRMNVDRLEREGSGYVGRHEPDILHAGDQWFRGVEVTYGPDGAVYLIDWSDTGECHEATGVHRTSGRIYKVTYGEPPRAVVPDLTTAVSMDLVKLSLTGGEWFSRAARRELMRRQQREPLRPEIAELVASLQTTTEAVTKLRALWTLHSLGASSSVDLWSLTRDADEHVRTWAIRLLTDAWPLDTPLAKSRSEDRTPNDPAVSRFAELARREDSGLVRLALASILQRLPMRDRPTLAAALLSRAEDAEDHNLPSLIWYGLLPIAEENPQALIPLALDSRLPQVTQWIARRCAELAAKQPALLEACLSKSLTGSEQIRQDLAFGIAAGLAGQRKVAAPADWSAFAATFPESSPNVQEALRTLGVVFGDGQAMDEVRRLVLNEKADLLQRRSALQTLIEAQPDDLREVCQKLLKVRFLNTTALQGLARFDDPTIGRDLARSYKSFHHSERAAVIETLVSRPSFAAELLEQMSTGAIARHDLSAAQARQIRGFDRDALTNRLGEVWGELRDSSQEKQALIDHLKRELTTDRLREADLSRGRALYQKHCASCHKLFGAGGEIGPDLTGANRQNLDYLLGNIVDPSAVVSKDFLMSVFALADGRVVNGLVAAEAEATLTVQTAQARQVLLKADIEERKQSKLSLMPDGLLQTLTPADIATLIAYLQSERQVELPVSAE
jgi:putative membrane-bound dehydrogenase-like protein